MSNLSLVNEGEVQFHIAHFEKSGAVEDEIAEHESHSEDDRLYEIESVPTPVSYV